MFVVLQLFELFEVPVLEQQLGAFLIEVAAVAGQVLIAAQDGHHREQKRVGGQLADGGGFVESALQAGLIAFAVGDVTESGLIPDVDESIDLGLFEILQRELLEAGVAELLRVG